MDSLRFDELVRSFSLRLPRRRMVRLLAGVVLGTALLADRGDGEGVLAHDPRRRCKRIKDSQRRRRCRRRAQQHARNHPGEPCSACPTGQHCLANDSCALPCTGPGTCPTGCFCADANTEGQRYCTFSNTICGVHSTCAHTAGCPTGEQCADCGGNNHCLTLCLG